jgi:hypothetical protein
VFNTQCLASIAWLLSLLNSCNLPLAAPVYCTAQNFGGNIDNRRIGKGASMYYPVQVRVEK